MKQERKPRVVIVGAGISGLSAGIYALDNGFDVSIYEKHNIAGGECTGWFRKGTYIDGCAHWVVGTNPKSDLFPLWKHVGAFDESTKIYQTEYLTKFQLKNGDIFTLYADINKMKKEMLRCFPEDKRMINHFIRHVKLYESVQIPVAKPMEYMNLFELMALGLKMLPMAIPFAHYKHVSMDDYCAKFKNKELGDIFKRFMPEAYNIHSFFYVCQALAMLDAGVAEGGSLQMMNRIKNTFLNKGGKLFLSQGVAHIDTEGRIAKGVTLESGEKVSADYVVTSCDMHHVLYDLLDKEHIDPYFAERFKQNGNYRIMSAVQVSFRTKKDLSSFPKMLDYLIPVTPFLAGKIDHFCIRNFSFDPLLGKNGYTSFTVLILTEEADYDYLKSLSHEDYLKEKEKIGALIKKEAVKALGFLDEDIELLDVTTPLTYERYCNAYKGAYQSFVTTKFSHGLMRQGEFKTLDNFIATGQWIMPPGGLPVALFTGKHAAYRLCKMERKRFRNPEKEDVVKAKSLSTKTV